MKTTWKREIVAFDGRHGGGGGTIKKFKKVQGPVWIMQENLQ